MRCSRGWPKISSGRALLDDHAAVHEDHPVGDLAGKAHLVGDDHHRHARRRPAGCMTVEHLADHLGVERGGRLVEEHDVRVHRQRAGDGHALLLPAGKLRRVGVRLVREAHALEQLPRAFGFRGGLVELVPVERARIVMFSSHRHVREEVELLEHHADVFTDFVEVGLAVGEEVSVHLDLSARGRLEEVEAAQEGRFAGAGRPDHADDLPLAHLEVDAPEHLQRAEVLAEALNPYLCHCGASFRSAWKSWTE